jgi:hypothetical protein
MTADKRGLVTVKAEALLSCPLTATVTPPSTAVLGTVTVRLVTVASVTTADTRVLLAPAKVTEFEAGVPLKFEPLTTMEAPSRAALGDRPEMAGVGVLVVVVSLPDSVRLLIAEMSHVDSRIQGVLATLAEPGP